MSVAVLLDNFITASTRMEIEEKEQETGKFLREKQANNPLEPLLIMVRYDQRNAVGFIPGPSQFEPRFGFAISRRDGVLAGSPRHQLTQHAFKRAHAYALCLQLHAYALCLQLQSYALCLQLARDFTDSLDLEEKLYALYRVGVRNEFPTHCA